MTLKERLTTVLKTVPRDFQVKGIEFLEATRGRALLGDDMGLGKTLQVLGYLALHPEITPVIIVCPSNAKFEWAKQVSQHTKSLRAEVVGGRKPYKIGAHIVIINYDILSHWVDYLLTLRPAGIVMDECHYVKNLRVARTKACKRLSSVCKVILPLSGTPIVNRPSEFFPVLNMIQPQKFSSFWNYAFRYCAPKRAFRGQGWDFSGSANTQELHNKVAPIMLRRKKSEVLSELPPKQRIPISVELSNRREYEKARDIFLAWYKENYGVVKAAKAAKAEGFVRLGKLRQLVAEGKIKAVETWINDYLESTDGKLVVFAYHRAIFDHFATVYKDICACGGGASEQRHQEIERFQTDPKCRLFVGTIRADNQAITLTAANVVLFIEQGWTPGEHDQAEDRIYRIGQNADSVSAYYFLGQNSVDDYVWRLIEQKRVLISKILDEEEKWTKLNHRVKLEDIVTKI